MAATGDGGPMNAYEAEVRCSGGGGDGLV